MRKALLAATVAIATMTSAVTAADISVGIDGMYGMNTENNTTKPSEGDETFDNEKWSDMFLMARVGIRTSELLEISPFFGFGFDNYKETYKTDLGDGLKEYEFTKKHTQIGAGVGVYFHLINKDWFELSTGPRLGWMMTTEPKFDSDVPDYKETDERYKEYDTYKNNTIGIDVPVNFDFLMGDAFGLRVGTELLSFDVTNVTTEVKESKTEEKTSEANFDILGLKDRTLSLGVFFRF